MRTGSAPFALGARKWSIRVPNALLFQVRLGIARFADHPNIDDLVHSGHAVKRWYSSARMVTFCRNPECGMVAASVTNEFLVECGHSSKNGDTVISFAVILDPTRLGLMVNGKPVGTGGFRSRVGSDWNPQMEATWDSIFDLSTVDDVGAFAPIAVFIQSIEVEMTIESEDE